MLGDMIGQLSVVILPPTQGIEDQRGRFGRWFLAYLFHPRQAASFVVISSGCFAPIFVITDDHAAQGR